MIAVALPAIEGLWRDTEIATSEPGIAAMGTAVMKPFDSLPGLLGQHRDACQGPVSLMQRSYHVILVFGLFAVSGLFRAGISKEKTREALHGR